MKIANKKKAYSKITNDLKWICNYVLFTVMHNIKSSMLQFLNTAQ